MVEKTAIQSPKPKRRISWEAFQEKYLTREDRYKYEWVDGLVEKTTRSMNKNQFFIQANLLEFLDSIKATLETNWTLIAEGDTFFDGKHRRPDIAFYTLEQIRAAKDDQNVVPEFVIEIISSKDQINRVVKKMDNYRAANVKVIWHIFPETQKVHVYHGKTMQICEEEDVCSAEKVIPGFKILVKDLFK